MEEKPEVPAERSEVKQSLLREMDLKQKRVREAESQVSSLLYENLKGS